MRRFKFFCLTLLLIVCLLTACDGYNDVMIGHLSDSANYGRYEVTLGNIFYSNGSNTLQEYTHGDQNIFAADRVVLEVYFSTDEETGQFYGVGSKPCDVYPVKLEINKANHQHMLERGFYENVSDGEKLVVKTSKFIYMDSNFFYISAVSCNGTEYLNESVGLSNIIAMIKKERSLF